MEPGERAARIEDKSARLQTLYDAIAIRERQIEDFRREAQALVSELTELGVPGFVPYVPAPPAPPVGSLAAGDPNPVEETKDRELPEPKNEAAPEPIKVAKPIATPRLVK